MSDWPTLARAPIVEGLIDLRVRPVGTDRLDALRELCKGIAADYPLRRDLHQGQLQIQLGPTASANIVGKEESLLGYRLHSADEHDVVQLRLDGFTYSRLRPYTSWRDVAAAARALWDAYSVVLGQQNPVRVAVRFINRIPMPPGMDMSEIFQTSFRVPKTFPQRVDGFLVRLAVRFEEANALALVSQAKNPHDEECIFDIDVFSEQAGGFTDEEAWTKLSALRNIKNRLFFESLTRGTLESFQ